MKAKRKNNRKQSSEDSYLSNSSQVEKFRNMQDIDRLAYLYDSANKCYDQDEW